MAKPVGAAKWEADAELAEFFVVAESTLNLWKKDHAEFSESIKRARRRGRGCWGMLGSQRLLRRMEAREKRTEITQDMVLRELAKIGFLTF